MTKQQAIDTGTHAAVTFGKPFVVYRFPAWPVDVFSVIARDRLLPMNAETFDVLDPTAPTEPQGRLW